MRGQSWILCSGGEPDSYLTAAGTHCPPRRSGDGKAPSASKVIQFCHQNIHVILQLLWESPWAILQNSAAKEFQMFILPESCPWRGDSQAWGLCVQCLVSGNAAKPKLSGKGHNKSATISDLLLQPGHLFQLYKGHFQPQTASLHLGGVLS